MKRRPALGLAVGSGLVVVTMVIGSGLNAWLRPDLSDVSTAELTSESWALLERCRTEPWYIGWAPALRSVQVHEEIRRRSVFGIGPCPETLPSD
ncbi:MAG: hypothetical protein AAGH71_06990 [Planctomycetota bacterium]